VARHPYPGIETSVRDKGPKEIDYVVVREKAGGVCTGQKHGRKTPGLGDHDTLALVGKTNVLTYVYDLWERVFHEIGERDYADVSGTTTTSTPAACGW
jgi:3-isopropylmalate dehydrogenase